MNKTIHLEKIIVMMSFKLSKGFQFLSESSKFKFERKLQYHVNQYKNDFVEMFKPIFDLFQEISKVISNVVNEIYKLANESNYDFGMLQEVSNA